MTDMRTINDMAARWHAQVMIGRLSPEDEQRLDGWLAQDVRHRLAYAEVAAAGYALQQLSPNAVTDKRIARTWPLWMTAALAPILLLVAAMWSPHAWQNWRSDAHTATGALHEQHLSDGSLLQLDTDTAVALSFAPDRRDVELLRGSLAVEVAKDPAHPFRVLCGGIEARAVGTRFVVARHAADVEVGVTEGVVEVRADEQSTPTLIQAGQRVRVDQRTGAIRSEPLPATSYGWTRGVLSFDHVPSEQVVAEIARYLPERVVFHATKHAATPITATFPLDQPDAALRAVARTNGLAVRHIPGLLYVVQD
jgi:transmembrane sensor